MRKTIIGLFALAAVGLVQPTVASARGGGGGGHGGGGGGHGGGFGGGGFHGGGGGGFGGGGFRGGGFHGLMHRNKQLKLFDHFVGVGEQKMRDCDLAELARVKRVNFPKAFCA
jgi:hypothetical protein